MESEQRRIDSCSEVERLHMITVIIQLNYESTATKFGRINWMAVLTRKGQILDFKE